jgi:hypothetical protein
VQRLTRADEAQRASEAGINRQAQEVRSVARSLAVAEAEDRAEELRTLTVDFIGKRTAFRALIRALSGQGAKFGPVAVDMFRSEVPTNEAVVNSPEYRREHVLADQWRQWLEAAVKNPNVEMPKEE